jgi:WhiB family redox-sensing transcriptional regulator
MVNDQHWATKAACTGSEPDELFVQGAAQRSARAVCMGCGVRLDCLADALDSGMRFGVWGGMTERERRAMLRKQPDVISWRSVLADSGSAAPDARCTVAGLPAGRR